MFIKLYKSTHNKFSKFFRFIFFIRYIFLIFFISFILFLSIPSYFDYEKRAEVVKKRFNQTYNFEINKYDKISFRILPLPHLQLNSVSINTNKPHEKITIENLKIYPKLLSIYNYDNFQINKIVLNNSKIILETSEFRILKKIFFSQKKKLFFKNLNLQIIEKKNPIIKFEQINFANYGYNKNLITGETFGKKFTLLSKDEFKTIKFKFENSGIITDINFDANKNRDFISGILKSKILNSNLKFNFKYKDKKLNLFNSFFRSKNISFNYDSFIIFKPFFKTNSKFIIEDINFKIFNELKIEDLLEKKKFLKKVNSKNYIKFKSKKYRSNLIDHLNLEFDLAYGRLIYFKKISINDHHFKCRGDTNLLEEFPLLFFDCNLISNNKHELLKKFSIKKKNKKRKNKF